MRIAWAFTGAGHLLLESVEELEKLAREHKVTIMVSRAAEEVLRMYGLFERVKKLEGGYYRELVLERDEGFSFPITGRLSLGRYDLLIVSPATANTVAKIVHGIADTLVTNAVAQAGKGKVRTIILPVDLEEGEVETVIPSKLELSICRRCETCNAAAACPQDAIIPGVEIQLLKCIGCGNCQRACPYGAVSGGSIITLHMRSVDVENTRRLESIEGVQVIKEPKEFWDHL
ncbi:MAG: dihydromethanopterin reductase (acceptor) [Methanothermobacter sp.]|nr:dihydromethanopterin reductase (acceptor) [Methanothermobacter sp.]